MVDDNFEVNLYEFSRVMCGRIIENWHEKGISWRKSPKDYLVGLIQKYAERRDWVSVANIAFMLWEKQQQEMGCVPPIPLLKGLFTDEL